MANVYKLTRFSVTASNDQNIGRFISESEKLTSVGVPDFQ